MPQHDSPWRFETRAADRSGWLRRLASLTALLVTLVGAQVVRAQPGEASAPSGGRAAAQLERRILVLRADDSPRTALESRVDRVLGQVLGELGFLVHVSPMPFRDAQLAVGCGGAMKKCGSAVASALDSEQLAVMRLELKPGADEAQLVLYLFAPGVTRDGSAELPIQSSTRLELAVRELARSVYEEVAPEPRVARKPQPVVRPAEPKVERVAPVVVADAQPPLLPTPSYAQPSERRRNHALMAVGWSATTLGGALLLSGLATGIAANNSSDAYEQREIRSRDDADIALANYARAERQADAARVLLGTGGVVIATGVALLLWERLAPNSDRKLQISPVPVARGAAVSLSRSFGGRSW